MPVGGTNDQALSFYRAQMEDAGKRIEFLEAELAAVRDLAYRGQCVAAAALEAIHQRASRALRDDDPENSLQHHG